MAEQISIHVPQVGHDLLTELRDAILPISIHVPQVGHDPAQSNLGGATW